jgi:S-formylglutathione hydrolase FrmB
MRWVFAVALAGAAGLPAQALPSSLHLFGPDRLVRLNGSIGGKVLEYTHNHGADNRGWSAALGQKRDVYVYLPPGYDGVKKFPVMLTLHGIGQDETKFLDFIPPLDEAIRSGALPPMVVVAPDGSILGRRSLFNTGSFYANSRAGNFEDYIVKDVWAWAKASFAVRPEREAHVIAGASMGGGGAYNIAFKHKAEFGHVVGILPALDFRYTDCTGNYFGDFDPNCIGRRYSFPRSDAIGRFYGFITVRQRRLLDPLVGREQRGLNEFTSEHNPVELLASRNVKPGEFGLFVGYAGKDEFNLDAAAEHFLYTARQRGIEVHAVKIPDGRHNVATGVKFFPDWTRWLAPRLAPYAPEGYRAGGGCDCTITHAPLVTGSSRPKYLAPMPCTPCGLGW